MIFYSSSLLVEIIQLKNCVYGNENTLSLPIADMFTNFVEHERY
jgi:hypothetical protein